MPIGDSALVLLHKTVAPYPPFRVSEQLRNIDAKLEAPSWAWQVIKQWPPQPQPPPTPEEVTALQVLPLSPLKPPSPGLPGHTQCWEGKALWGDLLTLSLSSASPIIWSQAVTSLSQAHLCPAHMLSAVGSF